MSGAPLDVLGSHLAQGPPDIPGVRPHVSVGVFFSRRMGATG
jgi:hypothetical protein